jgi:opacity protein-like surface antigen
MLKAAAAALILLAVPFAGALAADMPQLPPPQVVPMIMPAPVEVESAWYLRGDIGVGNMQSTSIDYLPNPLNNPSNFTIQSVSLQDQVLFLVGVGYEFNNWLRFDATAEYRNKDSFVFWGGYTTACPNPFAQCLDVYNGYISSWVFLANAYVDLFTWCGFTPFVGLGVGTAANTLAGFSDVGIPTGGAGLGQNTTDWNLAWAIHAGFSYKINENLRLELAYRFLNMGSVEAPINCIGGCNPDSYRFHSLESQDLMLGFRWMFGAGPVYVNQPQYVAPQPQYIAPQPQYIAPQPQMIMPAQPMMVPAQPMIVAPPLSTRG